jgi:hypothetical protein
MAVCAEERPADEAATWWQQYLRRAPSHEQFAQATSRSIPDRIDVPLLALVGTSEAKEVRRKRGTSTSGCTPGGRNRPSSGSRHPRFGRRSGAA